MAVLFHQTLNSKTVKSLSGETGIHEGLKKYFIHNLSALIRKVRSRISLIKQVNY
nr:MAG TPA: hypothetical protein [Caudoviricetes sp.]